MATAITRLEDKLLRKLGELHPDYSISIFQPISRFYPYIQVHNSEKVMNIEIRLRRSGWTVKTIDRLVKKAIEQIEGELDE